NVLLGLAGASLSRSEARMRAQETLTLCGIQSLGHRKPGSLSGGQQQRVALARALAGRPSFWVLDEPFSGPDLVAKTALMGEIADLPSAGTLTMILVSHDPLETTTLCRHAVILDQGRLQEAGAWEELLRDPRSEMGKAFKSRLGSIASGFASELESTRPKGSV